MQAPVVEGTALNYIYTPEGIYNVPLHYVVRDHNNSIPIKARTWHDVRAVHRRLTAATFLENKEMCISNIIVVTNTVADDHEASGRQRRCLWFVRLSVSSGCSLFEHTFGDNFLWQLPHGTCARIMSTLHACVPPGLWSGLTTHFATSQHDFNPAVDFPEFQLLETLPDYYDRVFAMSCAPCRYPISERTENAPILPKSLARGWIHQPHPGKRGFMDWNLTPCDVTERILDIAAEQMLSTPDNNDWKAFLKMRQVCKGWRDKCDASGTKMLKDLAKTVKLTLRTKDPSKIMAVRNKVLDKGLMTITLLMDSYEISIYNLMRLRSVKRPGSMPPPPDSVTG